MSEARQAFPRTVAVLNHGQQSGLHLGAQLYVSLKGKTVADLALGEARLGVPMRTDTLNLWLSSGKPLTAAAIAQQFEGKLLSFDDPVSRFIPEFAVKGKDGITVKHLLTHTAGFRPADALPEALPWDETIARICDTPIEPAWSPGQKAGYQVSSSWFVLAEIVRRIDGRTFDRYVRERILEPLELRNSWIGMPRERFDELGDRIGFMHVSDRDGLRPHARWNSVQSIISCRPGSNALGPILELGRFYEALLIAYEAPETQFNLLRRETIRYLSQRHRIGLFDHTFGKTLDWGLGFLINSNRYGAETVPYGYGPQASEETFGHSGSQSSCAFVDPPRQLVVAWICNGQPGEPRHQKRAREINTAIYEDLQSL